MFENFVPEEQDIIFEVTRLRSNTIEYVGYDEATKTMQITTRQGIVRDIRKVPGEIYNGLINAVSPDSYYDEKILPFSKGC